MKLKKRATRAMYDLGRKISEHDGDVPLGPFAVLTFLDHLSEYAANGGRETLPEYTIALRESLVRFIDARRAQADEADEDGVSVLSLNREEALEMVSAMFSGNGTLYDGDVRLEAIEPGDLSDDPCECPVCVAERSVLAARMHGRDVN